MICLFPDIGTSKPAKNSAPGSGNRRPDRSQMLPGLPPRITSGSKITGNLAAAGDGVIAGDLPSAGPSSSGLYPVKDHAQSSPEASNDISAASCRLLGVDDLKLAGFRRTRRNPRRKAVQPPQSSPEPALSPPDATRRPVLPLRDPARPLLLPSYIRPPCVRSNAAPLRPNTRFSPIHPLCSD